MRPVLIDYQPQNLLSDGSNKLTLLLRLNLTDFPIPEKVQVAAKSLGLRFKTEIHLTVLGFAASKILNQAIAKNWFTQDQLNQIIENFSQRWEIYPGPDFYLLEKTYNFSTTEPIPDGGQLRRTIINLVKAPAANDFILSLNNLAGKSMLPDPFPHVTLYTFGKNLNPKLANQTERPFLDPYIGIGLDSKADFESLQPRLII